VTPIQSAAGPPPISTQLPVAQVLGNEPSWHDMREDSIDSQDREYDNDSLFEESMEGDAKDVEDDRGD